MYTMSDFGNKLKNLREYRGIKSQRMAAQLIKKHHQQWYLWETGQSYPAAPQIIEICNTFKINIEYFYKEGLPQDFDFSGNNIKKNLIPFVETTVSRDLAKIIKETERERSITLVMVLPGCGSSRAAWEYKAMEEDVFIFNGKNDISVKPKSGLSTVILDHAEHKEDDEIKTFIKDIKNLTSGIVIISHRDIQSIIFDKHFKLKYPSITDIKNITCNALPELVELLNQNELGDFKNQILSILASEIIDNINKIEKLREKFQEDVLPNFSLENLLLRLSKL